MASTSGKQQKIYTAETALAVLLEDTDSDEGSDVPDILLQEVEHESADSGSERDDESPSFCKRLKTSCSVDEDLEATNYTAKDGTVRSSKPCNISHSGRIAMHNIVKKKGNSTDFVEKRSTTIQDVFLKLFDHQNKTRILKYTNIEAHRQSFEVNLRKDEFMASLVFDFSKVLSKDKMKLYWNFGAQHMAERFFRFLGKPWLEIVS